ncbi:DUF2306 domain-containing protein [Deinococcus alpinitundrae]|uniref:DUF2306 domain-containing protein n=1 Tax=Deinococcus alpinitundrae TaxID=468913 RepID=UPI001379D00E|nr:DUF2306 domain-containing protein [Deinococcus alpinitundrae]
MKRERIIGTTSPTPSQTARNEWLIPAALILLTLIPVLGGVVRLIGLAGSAEVTPANARFFALPIPVMVHITSASVFCILGAFQFMPGFRRRRPGWHRAAGRLVAVCGLAAASSGLWMTQFYPLSALHLQMEFLHSFRLLIGAAMLVSILLSVRAVLGGDIRGHHAWMMRGYAIGQGAGTQAVIGLSWVLLFGQAGELNREIQLILGWAVNLAVAEWIIRRAAPVSPLTPAVTLVA